MANHRLTRRQFLAGVGALSASALLSGQLPIHAVRTATERTYLPSVRNGAPDDRPNLITIVCDTLRYDHIGFHGNTWIHTPNIDAFATEAVVFDKAYAGGFPTLPNRAELFTGRWQYPYMTWDNLPATETVIARRLNDAGYITGLVFDTLALKDAGYTYEREFGSWEWIRGQLTDRHLATPRQPALPADPAKLRLGAAEITQYLRNVSERRSEQDYFPAQVMRTAIRWLERSRLYGPFYLHIDCFDPHEPWDPPRTDVDLYDPGYTGDEVIYPVYAPPAYLSPAELHHMRALYAGEVTLVDRWLGVLFDAIADMGLLDTTVIMLMSDHGILLGEHNAIGKAQEDTNPRLHYPLWEELAHIPLMIRSPGVAPRRTAALAQPADIVPTLLDLAGVERPTDLNGVSLTPLLQHTTDEEVPALRPIAVASRSLLAPPSAQPSITVFDGAWTLIYGSSHAPSYLFHLPDDPGQQIDRLAGECVRARQLHDQLVTFLESTGIPESRIAPWRVPPC